MTKRNYHLNNVFIFIFISAFIFAMFSMFEFTKMMLEHNQYGLSSFIYMALSAMFSMSGFYYLIFLGDILEHNDKIFSIKFELKDKMYQQFDDIDLTVFNTEYFESEDEVLNFILTKIPNWFTNCDAETLYECIKLGYLENKNSLYSITNKRKIGALEVYYIKG
jgi:hypothetical protein